MSQNSMTLNGDRLQPIPDRARLDLKSAKTVSGRQKILPVPAWAQGWFDMKVAGGLAVASLHRYSYDVKALGLDLPTKNIQEITRRLADLSSRYARGSLRNITLTTKQILKQLGRKDDADTIALPKHSPPRVVVYAKGDLEAMLKACNNLRDRLMIKSS